MDIRKIRDLATGARLSAKEANEFIGDLALMLVAAGNNQSELRKAHRAMATRLQDLVPLDRLLTALGFEAKPTPKPVQPEEGERYGVDCGWVASDPDFDGDYEL